MAGEIFLARTEEQEKFKQVLRSHDKTLWQKLNTPIFSKPSAENGLPFLLLFYGEGGMGKTRLIRRLRQIAEEEAALKGKFNTLFVDWEDKKNHHIGLQVGHDDIQPETLLQVLHDAFAKDWGGDFGEYQNLVKRLKEIEAKVDKELKSKPDDKIQTQVLMAEMQKIIAEEGSVVGALRYARGDAEVLARCPVKPAGIDTVVEMLKQAIS